MDEQRALLDSLMGVNRNADRAEDEILDYHDSRLCKMFLFGVCPSDLFTNVKAWHTDCDKLHDENMRKKFLADGQDESGIFDGQVENKVNDMVREMDRRIAREKDKLRHSTGGNNNNDALNVDALVLSAEIDSISHSIVDAIENGDDFDKALVLLPSLEVLNKEKHSISNRDKTNSSGPDIMSKLRVCDVCGSTVSIFDGNYRLADHFAGKLHEGYTRLRELKNKIFTRRQSNRNKRGRSRSISPPTDGRYIGDRDRDRDRDWGRDRYDRGYDHGRGHRDKRDRYGGGGRRDDYRDDRDRYDSYGGSRDSDRRRAPAQQRGRRRFKEEEGQC